MGEVINLDERRKVKMRKKVESVVLQGAYLNKKILSDLLMDAHPITIKQKAAGRILWVNVQKEHIFSILKSAENSGLRNIYVEKTAIYGTPEGVKVLEGCYAIYGKRTAIE